MTHTPPPGTPELPADADADAARPVLLWRPEQEDAVTRAGVGQAAEFLRAAPEEVLAAIASGEPLAGWFVDWEALRQG